MVDISADSRKSGLWLQLDQDGEALMAAHSSSDRVEEYGQITVMWTGHPKQKSLASFCEKVAEQLDVHGEGTMLLVGREFSKGIKTEFEGPAWLDAGAKLEAQLLRFECFATQRPNLPTSPSATERVIVWGAYQKQLPLPATTEDKPDEDENVGVNLPLSRLLPLEADLSTLIARTHRYQTDVGTIRAALRSLHEYLLPRPQAKIMAA
ncbi:hypothetical protein [Bradyrhizobium sp. NAS96.2]|uniref:hypothetical protein n=1 Tax=Bradyrhizobium sp. NAS96.2 TaxID=1680160 RepID=UPI000963137B|nr:hypothetical protein [Bradyrhizobium sp. NAS96.2]OKO83552.1 hypothetical protein AC628_01700 [Bradyrhizobium sp. NAS96.2]